MPHADARPRPRVRDAGCRPRPRVNRPGCRPRPRMSGAGCPPRPTPTPHVRSPRPTPRIAVAASPEPPSRRLVVRHAVAAGPRWFRRVSFSVVARRHLGPPLAGKPPPEAGFRFGLLASLHPGGGRSAPLVASLPAGIGPLRGPRGIASLADRHPHDGGRRPLRGRLPGRRTARAGRTRCRRPGPPERIQPCSTTRRSPPPLDTPPVVAS